jgi:hypothetical protein
MPLEFVSGSSSHQKTASDSRTVGNSKKKLENLVEPEEPKRRKRGEGCIYTNGSSALWIKYHDRGRSYRESTHGTDYKAAKRWLRRRLAEVETRTFVPVENTRVDELISNLMSYYR